MRRREYLHAAVGVTGLSGLAATAPPTAGTDDASSAAGASPDVASRSADETGASAVDAQESTDTATSTPTETDARDAEGDDSFEPLATVDVSGSGGFQASEAVTTPDGRYGFISKLDGFHVVDCDDPENPEIVATRDDISVGDGGRLSSLYDIKYNRDRLLVATEGGSSFTGFAVFDVRDRTDPVLTTSYSTTYAVHNCFLYGSQAYLTTRRSIEIVDLRPADPEPIAEWSVADYDEGYAELPGGPPAPHDVYVQADRMYVANWDAGTWIVDVSDPANPTHVGHVGARSPDELRDAPRSAGIEPPGNDHYVQPSDDGSQLFVGGESWNDPSNDEENGEDDPGGPSGIRIWDVEDPSEPAKLATVDPPPVPEGEDDSYQGYSTTSHNFDVVGEYLYSSWYQGGVKVHDISDPESPEELAHWENGQEASFWTARVAVPGEFFVASKLLDPSDGTAPGGFYVFPDPSDNDATVTPAGPDVDIATPTATPAGTTDRTETDVRTDAQTGTGTATADAAATSTRMSNPPATRTGSGTHTATPTDSEETVTSGDGPGFGPLAALGAVGVGAWRFLRDGDG